MEERIREKGRVFRFNKFHTNKGNRDALKKTRRNCSEFRHSYRYTNPGLYVMSIYYI